MKFFSATELFSIQIVFNCRPISDGVIFFRLTPKLVEFPSSENPCDDRLYFRTDTNSEANVSYCNSKASGVETYNGDAILVNGQQFFEINYRVRAGSAGGKFWLQVEATHVGKNRHEITRLIEMFKNLQQGRTKSY